MGLKKFSDFKKSRIEVKEATHKKLADKKFNEKLKGKLSDLGVTSISELDEDQMTNLLDSLKPSVDEYNTSEMMSVKESCGKIHEMAKMYDSDEHKDHTYENYVKETMEMLKEMYESYTKEGKSYESTNEHTIKFSKEDMAKLHKDGKVVKKDDEGKDHTYLYTESVNEAEIKSDEEFKEYATTILKKAFKDKFDEEKANKTIEGILKKVDGDYGAAVGTIQASLG